MGFMKRLEVGEKKSGGEKSRRIPRFLVWETKEKGKPIYEIGDARREQNWGEIWYLKCLRDTKPELL